MDLLTKALEASPLDERSKGQWSFALRQVTDALSPANNLMTNPEAQQLALETGGKSLIEGLKLFTEDLAKGRISMTEESAFEVGENVATTPGTVIFENEIIQLIPAQARWARARCSTPSVPRGLHPARRRSPTPAVRSPPARRRRLR